MLVMWERVSAVVFALFYADNVPDLTNFFQSIVFSGEYTTLLIAYVVVGGVLATIVFSATVIAIPMMMARDRNNFV